MTTTSTQPAAAGVTNPNKALWEKGDFTKVAALMRQSGEELVRTLGLPTPARVLDLGCGDGTTALPLARLGAEVTGIDIAGYLVTAGNLRAEAAGLGNLRFLEGDACELRGVGRHSFDATVSIFGAMFAPKPHDVAAELVRVTKPDGLIVMGNWIPNDAQSFVSQLLRISGAFTPPPPLGFVSPILWGVEAHVIERFAYAGVPLGRITMARDIFHFRSPDLAPAQVVEIFRRHYAPTMNAYEAAAKAGREQELHRQLLELATACNRATDGGTLIPASYLRVTVRP